MIIPTLYEASGPTNADIWGDKIAPLGEMVSAYVTEERNGDYYLECEYPASGQYADELMVNRFIQVKPNRVDPVDYFRIWKMTRSLSGNIKITAYHHSYDLRGFLVDPTAATFPNAGIALYSLGARTFPIYASVRYDFNETTAGSFSFSVPAVYQIPRSFRDVMGGIAGSILDICGGEWKFSQKKISLLTSRGQDTGKKIIYGANMTELKHDISLEGQAYMCQGYYVTQENGVILSDYYYNYTNVPFLYAQAYDVTEEYKAIKGETEPTEAELSAFMVQYLSRYLQDPTVSIDVNYIELHDTEEYAYLTDSDVGLCDQLTVIHPATGLNLKTKIVKLKYNCMTGRYDTVTIGTIKKNLVDLLKRIK